MTSLAFSVLDVFAEPYAAAPQLTARLRIEESSGQVVHAIALRCQVRIEAQRRGYDAEEEAGLRSLFGERARWASTLRPLLWMQCNTTVQGFSAATEVDLALPCTYDFEVTAARYLDSLGDGAVPLLLMFSGTVFTRGGGPGGGFGVEQVPWDREARYQLPVAVWREMVDRYYPGTGWIRLERDLLHRLGDYKDRHGLTGWDETVRALLAVEGQVVP